MLFSNNIAIRWSGSEKHSMQYSFFSHYKCKTSNSLINPFGTDGYSSTATLYLIV